ncbi:MAG: hypothetical protein ACREO1_14145 [Arenimonas sp.]
MSDSHKTQTSAKSQKYFVPGIMFVFLGMAIHPVFFLGALVASIDGAKSRNQKFAMTAFAVFCMIVAFGYKVGKDMAIHDNHAAALRQDKTP